MNSASLEPQILEEMRNARFGISTSDLSKTLGVNRVTLVKYLEVLYSKGQVSFRRVGMAKLWFIPEYSVLEILSKDADFSKVLKRSRVTNEILMLKKPVVILPREYLYVLYEQLAPEEQQRMFKKAIQMSLDEYERISGVQWASLPLEDKEHFAQLWINFVLGTGWGKLKEFRAVSKTKYIYQLENNIVAESVKLYSKKKITKPVCHMVMGRIQGFVERVVGSTCKNCKEIKCIAKGDPYCEFQIEITAV